jgi:hypothetical protein
MGTPIMTATAETTLLNDVEMADVYLSIGDIGRELGVSENTSAGWISRYDDWPEPDVTVGLKKPVKGWKRERLPEWRTWLDSRPGRGAGGGRPRKDSERVQPVEGGKDGQDDGDA